MKNMLISGYPQLFAGLAPLFSLISLSGSAVGADAPISLRETSQIETRVETRVETSGELKLLVNEGATEKKKAEQKTTRLPVEVNARFVYDDYPLSGVKTPLLSHRFRSYETAEAKFRVGKGDSETKLHDDHASIIVHETTDAANIFSPLTPLEREEVDLLLVPGDSGLVSQLLTEKPVAIGDKWQPSNELMARFLRWDSVSQSDVSITFARLEKNVAILEMTGKASGGVDGVTSEVELNGKINFDLDKKLCTWLAAAIKENRAASQGTPGFETTTRVRTIIAPGSNPLPVSKQQLAQWKTVPDDATTVLRFRAAQQGFEMVHDPNWRTVSNQHDVAVLRLLERGDMIAQANVSRLDPLPAGEQLSLEGFQTDLKRSLGKSLLEFVEASESLNENGIRVLRVVASGVQSDVPLHWVFYHLSDDKRQRASLAFTMDGEMVERFGRSDETLVSSFLFTEVEKTAKTTSPAAQQSAKPATTPAKR